MIYFNSEWASFFEELAQNNHREWFAQHKARYEKEVREPFLALLTDLVPIFQKIEPTFQEDPRKTVFRINRDIRFSKNKLPYKTYIACVFCARGKNTEYPGFYLHIDAQKCWIGGGCYDLSKENLYQIRQEIAYDSETWEKSIQDPEFVRFYGNLADCEENKKLPIEFKTFQNLPQVIFKKRFYYSATLPSSILLSENLLSTLEKYIYASRSVYTFLCKAFG